MSLLTGSMRLHNEDLMRNDRESQRISFAGPQSSGPRPFDIPSKHETPPLA